MGETRTDRAADGKTVPVKIGAHKRQKICYNSRVEYRLTDCWCASALGRGADETLANYLAKRAPGMTELDGDVPSRKIRFGMVPGELPEVDAPEFRMRCSALSTRPSAIYPIGSTLAGGASPNSLISR